MLRRWRPDQLASVADRMFAEEQRLLAVDDELVGSRSPWGWSGAAAQAWAPHHEALSEDLRRLVAGVAAARRAVDEAAQGLSAVARALAAAEDDARSYELVVTAEGEVVDSACVTGADAAAVEGALMQRERARAEIGERLLQVRRRATELDETLHDALARVCDGAVDDGVSAVSLQEASRAGWGDVSLAPVTVPVGADPATVAGWWATLTPGDRETLLASHAAQLGGLDGLPAVVRDRANRSQLPLEAQALDARIAALEAQLVALRAALQPRDTHAAARAREVADQLALVREKRAAVGAIEAVLARGNRQLLVFDLSGRVPKAAIAVGDVDTAAHVSVFTPGFSNTVSGSMRDKDGEMYSLWKRATYLSEHEGDGGGVATVAWFGYDVPQVETTASPGRSVLTDGAAQAGAKDLERFYGGITASQGDDVHLTALGHSYGSLTTGLALARQRGAVDDVVFFGSPGVGTDHVADLHTSSGKAYVIEAKRDAVADLGRFGADPNQNDEFIDLSSQAGRTPDTGGWVNGSTGHSAYLTSSTMSQYNLAAIVAGAPALAVAGEQSGVGDFLRDL